MEAKPQEDKILTEDALASSGSSAEGSSAGVQGIEIINGILILVGVLASLYFKNLNISLSFLAGGLLTAINLRLLKLLVHNLTRSSSVSRSKIAIQIVLKLFFGFGALALLLFLLKLNIIAFLLGLSTIVLSITIEGIRGAFKV